MKTILRALIRLYQLLLSPVLGTNCRFAPTCSHYACEAVETHGAMKGAWLAAKRIARCHPWGESCYDPVPSIKSKNSVYMSRVLGGGARRTGVYTVIHEDSSTTPTTQSAIEMSFP